LRCINLTLPHITLLLAYYKSVRHPNVNPDCDIGFIKILFENMVMFDFKAIQMSVQRWLKSPNISKYKFDKKECNEAIKAILVIASIALLNVPYLNENDEEAQLMSYIYALSDNNGISSTCLHVLCAILFGIAEESDFQNQVSMKEYANFFRKKKPSDDF
jgi:hypothetical protein